MTQETINVGTIANDGTGDVLRISFEKTNNNFSELYNTTSDIQANLNVFFTAVNTFEGAIYDQTSAAFGVANGAYSFANAQYTAMNAAFTMANTVNTLFTGAVINAKAAFDTANAVNTTFTSYYNATNTAINLILNLGDRANLINSLLSGASSNLQSAYDFANATFILAGEAYDAANGGISLAVGAIANVESAYGFANGVSVNTAASYRVANSTYNVTNVAYGAANAVFYKTNSAYATVNAAYNYANTKVNTVNGIATGIFNVQGTHRVDGNVIVYGSTNTFEVRNGQIFINGTLWNPTPVGAVIYSASLNTPVGYLYANGSAVSRITYSALFAEIGTTFGPGDGSTTFNLPDLRGTFLRGWDDGKGIDAGRVFGSAQGDLFASHNHGITDPGHHHTIYENITGGVFPTGNYMLASGGNYYNESGVSTTGISVNSSGGSETRPKNVALKPFIKF
jgi:microcystin-dependent protein